MIAPFSSVSQEQLCAYLRDYWGMPDRVTAWKYYDARFNAGRERGFVWIKDDQIKGFLGTIPFTLHDGETSRNAVWLVDWCLASKDTSPGMGIMLLRKVIQECGLALSLGGSRDTLHILPRMAALTSEGAGCMLRRRLRLGTALERFQTVPVLGAARPLLQNLPLPGALFRTRKAPYRLEPGVSQHLRPLLQAPCPPAPSGLWRSCYDFEYVSWQIGRCPEIECCTVLAEGGGAPPAAALLWHPKGDSRFWRLALWHENGAQKALEAVLHGALNVVYRRGGWELWGTVSHNERTLLEAMGDAGFTMAAKRIPLFICNARQNAPVRDFSALNYLDTDRAYRF